MTAGRRVRAGRFRLRERERVTTDDRRVSEGHEAPVLAVVASRCEDVPVVVVVDRRGLPDMVASGTDDNEMVLVGTVYRGVRPVVADDGAVLGVEPHGVLRETGRDLVRRERVARGRRVRGVSLCGETRRRLSSSQTAATWHHVVADMAGISTKV